MQESPCRNISSAQHGDVAAIVFKLTPNKDIGPDGLKHSLHEHPHKDCASQLTRVLARF